MDTDNARDKATGDSDNQPGLRTTGEHARCGSCGGDTTLGFDLCDGCNLDEANTHPADRAHWDAPPAGYPTPGHRFTVAVHGASGTGSRVVVVLGSYADDLERQLAVAREVLRELNELPLCGAAYELIETALSAVKGGAK